VPTDSGEPKVQDWGERVKARRQGGRNRIGRVGEVGGSPMRLSVAVRIERGGATVRSRRDGWGWSWKGAPARGGARGGDGLAEGWPEGATLGGQRCGSRRRHDARRSRGRGERKKSAKRGSSSVGCSF
jgi:hypothetical protein